MKARKLSVFRKVRLEDFIDDLTAPQKPTVCPRLDASAGMALFIAFTITMLLFSSLASYAGQYLGAR